MNDRERFAQAVTKAIPKDRPDIIDWAEEFVKFPKSARSKSFRLSLTPWLGLPIRCGSDRETRRMTLVKPVQTGGSVAGEVILDYWIEFFRGFIQYNWNNDKRAEQRWDSRIAENLKACPPILEKIQSLPRDAFGKCEIEFGQNFLRVQGAFEASNLDSDSVHFQLNEEVHSWEPGHLQKARNRGTAIWNYKSFDISNAGKLGDQLNEAFDEGTKQYWEVLCPGCKTFHYMFTRWDDRAPQRGGLRYDATGCRRKDGTYDYFKLASSVRFQMPCGYVVHNDVSERVALSDSGRYGAPTNTGADGTHKSFTYEAVAVDYIDWIQLIKEKHTALRAKRLGNPEDWYRYVTERECIFYDPNDIPIIGLTRISAGLKKSRAGFTHPNKLRLFALDRQQGETSKGEFPYWVLVIRDFLVDEGLKSLLVYEGQPETDEEVIKILDDHKCQRLHGCADSGDDTTHVYLFCLKYGINAIKGGKESLYTHPNGARRIFGVERPLHAMLSMPPLFEYIQTSKGKVADPREPLFWLYSKFGIRERHYWMRALSSYQTPDDVSVEYQSSQESEERVLRPHPRTNEDIAEYIKLKKKNDHYVCECYIAMMAEMAGFIGQQPTERNEKHD